MSNQTKIRYFEAGQRQVELIRENKDTLHYIKRLQPYYAVSQTFFSFFFILVGTGCFMFFLRDFNNWILLMPALLTVTIGILFSRDLYIEEIEIDKASGKLTYTHVEQIFLKFPQKTEYFLKDFNLVTFSREEKEDKEKTLYKVSLINNKYEKEIEIIRTTMEQGAKKHAGELAEFLNYQYLNLEKTPRQIKNKENVLPATIKAIIDKYKAKLNSPLIKLAPFDSELQSFWNVNAPEISLIIISAQKQAVLLSNKNIYLKNMVSDEELTIPVTELLQKEFRQINLITNTLMNLLPVEKFTAFTKLLREICNLELDNELLSGERQIIGRIALKINAPEIFFNPLLPESLLEKAKENYIVDMAEEEKPLILALTPLTRQGEDGFLVSDRYFYSQKSNSRPVKIKLTTLDEMDHQTDPEAKNILSEFPFTKEDSQQLKSGIAELSRFFMEKTDYEEDEFLTVASKYEQKLDGDRFYFYPGIPKKILLKACEFYSVNPGEQTLLIIDHTFGKNIYKGCLITDQNIYYRHGKRKVKTGISKRLELKISKGIIVKLTINGETLLDAKYFSQKELQTVLDFIRDICQLL